MDVGKIAASLMGTLLIFLCLMASIYYLIPLYQKVQMDQICREYTYMINTKEGISPAMRENLKTELTQLGLEVIEIQCPEGGTLMRRERKPFVVKGLVKYKEVVGFINIREAEGHYEFTGWVYGKRIIN